MELTVVDFLKAICTPSHSPTDAAIRQSLMQRYTATLEQLLAHDAAIPEQALQFIDDNLDRINDSERLWQVGLGTFNILDLGQDNYVAQYLMLLTSLGGEGQWSCELATPFLAYFDCNPVMLSGAVHCQSDGASMRIRDGYGIRRYTLSGRHWLAEDDAILVSLRQSQVQFQLFSAAHPLPDTKRFDPHLALSTASLSAMEQSLLDACALIEQYYPEGVAWLARGIKGVVFFDAPEDRSQSGSSLAHPGLCYMTYPMDTDMLATLLIHECAHQYFRLCEYHVQLAERNGETVFSPFRQSHRPVEKVMLALHAAVNIKLLTQRLLDRGFDTDFIFAENEQLEKDIRAMSSDLDAARSVTPAGRQFLELMCGP